MSQVSHCSCVWLVRFNSVKKYRGGDAKNMKEEFSTYGLPSWSVYVVGFFKIVIALSMFLVLFVPSLNTLVGIPALMLLVVLMLGAISMHIKVKDPFIKVLPAISMLLMALVSLLFSVLTYF